MVSYRSQAGRKDEMMYRLMDDFTGKWISAKLYADFSEACRVASVKGFMSNRCISVRRVFLEP